MHQLEFRAMGSQMLALIDSEGFSCELALSQAPRWFECWEQQLSRFRPDSELMRLNAAGELEHAGAALWEVLALALQAAEQSDGLVTPLVLDAVEAAGYTVSFDELRSVASDMTSGAPSSADGPQHPGDLAALDRPSGEADALAGPAEAKRGDGVRSSDIGLPPSPHHDTDTPPAQHASSAALGRPWHGIRRVEETRSISLEPGLRLDLGGFAKGWAADRAAAALAATGPTLVDAGGDIAVSGPLADGSPWVVAVADPREPEANVALLLLRHGGVCTSGRDYRRWLSGGAWQHHIVDPRTGRPAQTDLLSVTVVGPSASQAEIAAKAALILGSAEGLAWIEARPELAALFVREDGRLVESQRLAEYRWKELP